MVLLCLLLVSVAPQGAVRAAEASLTTSSRGVWGAEPQCLLHEHLPCCAGPRILSHKKSLDALLVQPLPARN